MASVRHVLHSIKTFLLDCFLYPRVEMIKPAFRPGKDSQLVREMKFKFTMHVWNEKFNEQLHVLFHGKLFVYYGTNVLILLDRVMLCLKMRDGDDV